MTSDFVKNKNTLIVENCGVFLFLSRQILEKSIHKL